MFIKHLPNPYIFNQWNDGIFYIKYFYCWRPIIPLYTVFEEIMYNSCKRIQVFVVSGASQGKPISKTGCNTERQIVEGLFSESNLWHQIKVEPRLILLYNHDLLEQVLIRIQTNEFSALISYD